MSVISRLLLIALGVQMLTGQMTAIAKSMATSPLTELGLEVERPIDDSWKLATRRRSLSVVTCL